MKARVLWTVVLLAVVVLGMVFICGHSGLTWSNGTWEINAYVGWEFLDMDKQIVFYCEEFRDSAYPFVRGHGEYMEEAGSTRVRELKERFEDSFTPLVIVAHREQDPKDADFHILNVTCDADSRIYDCGSLGRFEYQYHNILRALGYGAAFHVPAGVEYTCFWLLPVESLVGKVYLNGHTSEKNARGNWIHFRIAAEHGRLHHDGEESPSTREEEARLAAPSSKSEEGVYIVVLDPGYGGEDPGAIGRVTGLKAKEVNLQVAQEVAKKLEDEGGIRVYLTRDSDRYLSLDRRTEIANQLEADMFISIHANADSGCDARGVETFFNSRYSYGEGAEEGTARENSPPGSENFPDGAKLIIWDLIQNAYRSESNDLAHIVQKELVRATGLEDRGVKSAGFYVLRGSAMPAVLVVVGFLSNAWEERMLRKKEFIERIASGIARGVRRYYEENHS